jgi:hypothetical protein
MCTKLCEIQVPDNVCRDMNTHKYHKAVFYYKIRNVALEQCLNGLCMVEYIFYLIFYVSATANMEVDGLADELHRQKEECRKQHEELAILASKLLYAESQINKVSYVV